MLPLTSFPDKTCENLRITFTPSFPIADDRVNASMTSKRRLIPALTAIEFLPGILKDAARHEVTLFLPQGSAMLSTVGVLVGRHECRTILACLGTNICPPCTSFSAILGLIHIDRKSFLTVPDVSAQQPS